MASKEDSGLIAFLERAGFVAAQVAFTNAFQACGIRECAKRSLGFVCGSCSRPTCLSHTYLQPTKPPRVLCAACVIDSHPELLQESKED